VRGSENSEGFLFPLKKWDKKRILRRSITKQEHRDMLVLNTSKRSMECINTAPNTLRYFLLYQFIVQKARHVVVYLPTPSFGKIIDRRC
jgi:hypothetical protein